MIYTCNSLTGLIIILYYVLINNYYEINKINKKQIL